MATILTKRSNTASSVPVAGDLTNSTGGAELAVNTADKRLFTKDSGGTVVELGTNPSSITLASGTANAVPYLNGSKVLTSGSALTFDGTNLGVGAGSALTNITINGNASGGFIRGQRAGANQWFVGDTASALGGGTGLINFVYNNDPFIWYNGGTSAEQMRLTSTGLGIGTSSPAVKLSVQGNAIIAGSNPYLAFGASASAGSTPTYIERNGTTGLQTFYNNGTGTNGAMAFVIGAGSEGMRLDSSGNLGLGVTPSAWTSAFKAFQFGTIGSLVWNGSTDVYLSANYASIGGTSKYIANGYATLYGQSAGSHAWYTAPSGTAGNAISFTQAMTLDASSILKIAGRYQFLGNASNTTGDTAAFWDQAGIGPTINGYNISFQTGSTERARIDSSGVLLVGATSNVYASSKLYVAGDQAGGGAGVATIMNTSASGADASPPLVVQKTMSTTSSSARFVQFYADGQSVPMGGIVGNGASNVQFATLSDVREKTNIQSISGSLAKINALRPVEFDWIADGSHVKAGFVAQEVETVFPEFVVENMANEGQEARKGLTGGMTGGIVAHLVKAIQEQQAIIDQLKARLDAANL